MYFSGHYLLITNWSLLLPFVCELNTGGLTIIGSSITDSPIIDQQGKQPSDGLRLALAAYPADSSYHSPSVPGLDQIGPFLTLYLGFPNGITRSP